MEDDGERKAFLSRIGTFFILLGLLVVVLFVASDIGEQTYFRYFFIGGIMLIAGLILKRIGAPPPSESKRFTGLRTWQKKRREAKVKKETDMSDPKLKSKK